MQIDTLRCGLAVAGLLGACGLAAPVVGQRTAEPRLFADVIDVRTGFVRVTLPAGVPPPRAEELEVLWKGRPQPVLRVVGGAHDPLELGVAVDRSASMHAAFEPMRAAALTLVGRGIAESDRVFVVGFTDEARLLAEGRGAAQEVLSALPSIPEPGSHPTALWQSLTRALELFGNADARAALIVVSDGCNTASDLVSAASVARRASALAIPIFLVMPGRDDCINTTCTADAAGTWSCAEASPPRIERRYDLSGERVQVEMLIFTQNTTGARSTAERSRFAGLIGNAGGGAYVVNDPADWQRALDEIFELIGRQWTVVFEPIADEVKSDEIRVYTKSAGRRQRLR